MADNIPNIDFNVAPGDTVAVPVDATLSISGQAADAKAVGDALANKADKSELARSIHVNGQGADLQGEIILTAEHVPMDENETVTVAEEVAALKGRTGADIPVNGEDGAISIEAALNAASSGVTVQGGAAVMAGTVTDDSGSVNSLEISGRSLPLRDDGAVRSVNGIAGDSAGNVRITNVETANNLVADDAQSNVAAFVLRTSGGGTAIANGRAWLNQVRGAMEHTGVVEERIDMTVEPAAREAGQQAITATIDRAAFRAAVPESGTITLEYGTQDWSEDPASIGITVSGTPVEGDRITVEYDKADRGLITPATPTSFRSTGWNLYSHARGYARVVRYSEIYGFRVAGAYTSLTYSETETGARQTITPVDGAFNVPGDGYVWVAGGNASTTAIYMTWSDWTDGYEGSFAAYTESAISLAAVMAEHFPNGLLAVGGTADVIDLDLKTATIAIERLDYSEETIAQLEAAGRAYEADADYIYAVLEEPVTVTDIGVSNQFTVNDHGMEYVTGTTVAPVLMLLYGQNLRDKLRMDVVTISQQSLTSAQQRQVRTNLGITPANIGALATSGGQMTGDINMGQNAAGAVGHVISWTGSDGTLYYMRPSGANFQIVRRPPGGSSQAVLNINADGTISTSVAAAWRTGLGAAAASDVSDLIIKRSFTLTTAISLNSLASTSFDVPVTTPTGYKPIAALEGRVNGGIFAVTVNLINNTTARAYVINAGSGERTGTGVTVDILFIRDI